MKRQYIKPWRKGISFFMAAACVCTLLTGCGQAAGETQEVEEEKIPVEVQMPEAGKLTLKNEFVGTISPEESVYVISTVSAEVLSTNVSVGDTVNAGDVLCKLDDKPAELQLASAEAQYNSAAAGVNSAQVGYEIAEAQYDSTMAQLDAQLGGQKNLQLYQLQVQVDTIQGGIDDIYEQMADLDEDKEDAKDQRDDLKSARDRANSYLSKAKKAYVAAQQAVTALDLPEGPELDELVRDQFNNDRNAYNEALAQAKEQLEAAKSAYEQAGAAAGQAEAAYEQAKAGIEAIDDGKDKLSDTLADTYKSLEQAEAVKNITEEQIYSDTQKVVDANRKTAALGLDSAAATVNSAQVGVAGAKVAIDSAKYQMDMYTLTAPIGGVIEAVNVKEHDFATPSSPAYVISNKDTMTVTFHVSEGIRNTLSVGQKVDVDRNGKMYDAAITEIGNMIDQTTGLFAVKACVSKPDESLLTGCSVKVTADTYSQDNAILIPYDAVYYDGGQPYVYVAVGETAERRDVELGIFDEQTVTILSGLTVEEQLITSWSANLREGALIAVQHTQDSAADSAAESDE